MLYAMNLGLQYQSSEDDSAAESGSNESLWKILSRHFFCSCDFKTFSAAKKLGSNESVWMRRSFFSCNFIAFSDATAAAIVSVFIGFQPGSEFHGRTCGIAILPFG